MAGTAGAGGQRRGHPKSGRENAHGRSGLESPHVAHRTAGRESPGETVRRAQRPEARGRPREQVGAILGTGPGTATPHGRPVGKPPCHPVGWRSRRKRPRPTVCTTRLHRRGRAEWTEAGPGREQVVDRIGPMPDRDPRAWLVPGEGRGRSPARRSRRSRGRRAKHAPVRRPSERPARRLRESPGGPSGFEVRNPKSEARNPKQIQRTEIGSTKREEVSPFGALVLCFGFVSDFVLRISDLLYAFSPLTIISIPSASGCP